MYGLSTVLDLAEMANESFVSGWRRCALLRVTAEREKWMANFNQDRHMSCTHLSSLGRPILTSKVVRPPKSRII
jgi:hypothetical protein